MMMSGKTSRRFNVVEPHDPGNAEPLFAGKGEKLRYERKPTTWAGWIWCTAENGMAAWVPEQWVEIYGESCVLMRDYSSKELTVTIGETIEVELEESGWVWARNSSGDRGWVPAHRLREG